MTTFHLNVIPLVFLVAFYLFYSSVNCDSNHERISLGSRIKDSFITKEKLGDIHFDGPSGLGSELLDSLESTLAAPQKDEFIRTKRASGRAKPMPHLFRQPTTTTTTTSTTISPTTRETPKTREPDTTPKVDSSEEDSAGSDDDYVDIATTKKELVKASTDSPKASLAKDEAYGSESEDSEESDDSDDSIVSTTTTTTTTLAPPKKSASGRGNKTRQKSLASADKAAQGKNSSGRKSKPKEKDEKSSEANTSLGNEESIDGTKIESNNKKDKPRKEPLININKFVPIIKPKNQSICIPEAYREFPNDFIGDKWRSRGFIVIHVVVALYMFYSLALVCERYFMPSLEEFSQRLGLSEDVAGATLMSAGSSAPELFTALLGVFVAKGDVGTGTIVGSAVFNILCVIGICAFVSSTTAQLNWWPVLRDSVFYTFTVLVLILFIYDERVTALESSVMLALYGVYILIMMNNETIKAQVTLKLQSHPITAGLLKSVVSLDGPDDVFAPGSGGSTSSSAVQLGQQAHQSSKPMQKQTQIEDDSMCLAALLIIVKHKRLFKSQLRFQSAARYIIIKRQHRVEQQKLAKSLKRSDEVNYFGPENEPLRPSAGLSNNQRQKMDAYARTASASKSKFSIVSKDDYEFWNRPPDEGENYYLWMAKIPVNYVLHYTVPDSSLYPDKYLITFFMSILWTALFSYIMVWMVTLIGYTLGIPDSIMGMTFLAIGTSITDCYSSIHAAKNGMADMAVSNSIGSNVFDILVGLALPWLIQTAFYPGVVATINSRGIIYSVILLFLSLVVTIYLMNKHEWTLKPRLGLALLIAYGLFLVLTVMLELNLFGHVNPPPCP